MKYTDRSRGRSSQAKGEARGRSSLLQDVRSGKLAGQDKEPDAGRRRRRKASRRAGRRGFGAIKWNGSRVPHFFQGDERWKNIGLNDDDTIGSAGCAISSVAMMLRYFGRDVTPADVDAHMDRNGGYQSGRDGIKDWNVALATKEEPGLRVTWAGSIRLYDGGDRDEMYRVLHDQLAQNRPVMGRIKYGNPTTSGDVDHFLLIVRRTRDGNHVMNDPAHPEGDGASDPTLPNVVLETATRNGGYNLVGIDYYNVETA